MLAHRFFCCGEDAVKMAAHRVPINLEGGVRARSCEAKNKRWKKAAQFTLITVYVLSVAFIALCGTHTHTYAKLIAQEVE